MADAVIHSVYAPPAARVGVCASGEAIMMSGLTSAGSPQCASLMTWRSADACCGIARRVCAVWW